MKNLILDRFKLSVYKFLFIVILRLGHISAFLVKKDIEQPFAIIAKVKSSCEFIVNLTLNRSISWKVLQFFSGDYVCLVP